jgi:hypothetical protein
MTSDRAEHAGVAADVPYVAVPPDSAPSPSTPVVVAWHLLDPPRSETALRAALPLAGLDAWRIYLGLPLSGSRLPAGGLEELMRLGNEDAVLNLHGPINAGAAEEFGPAFAELRERLGLGNGPVGLLGGSAGAAVAASVLAQGGAQARAAVLVSPLLQLRQAVSALERRYGVTYPWSEPSLAVARRMDFVARAGEIAANARTATLLIVGGEEEPEFRQSAEDLHDALAERYGDPELTALETIPGMGHPLADEPGLEPAPQNEHAAQADALAVRWFARHLTGARPEQAGPGEDG